MHPRHLAVLAACCLAAGASQGQAVYRCGNAYQQQPCAGGKEVDTTDRPTARDVAQAARATQADQKRADSLEKARLAREKNAPKAVVMGPKQPASAAKPAPPMKGPEVFTAKGPAPAKK